MMTSHVPRGPVAFGTVFACALSALRAGAAVAIALLIAEAVTGADGTTTMVALAVAVAATVALRAALSLMRESFAARAVSAMTADWRGRIFRSLVAEGPLALSGGRSGAVQGTLGEGVEAAANYQVRYRPVFFTSFIAPLGMAVLLAVVAWPAALAALAGALVTLLAPALWYKAREQSSAGVFTDLATLDADYTDTIQGLLTIKACDAAARWRTRITRQSEAVERSVMRELHVTLGLAAVTQLAVLGGTLGAVTAAAWMSVQGDLGLAGALIVLFTMREIYRPIQEVGALAHSAMSGAKSVEAVNELLARADAAAPATSADASAELGTAGSPSIHFDDVTLRYPGRDHDALNGVSFEVLPGETVAIVGPSGAGKSTIASLLMRFAEPTSGRILIAGKPTSELNTAAVRALTALVAQDTYLFHGTVRENIALARPAASDPEIHAAARRAGVDEMITGLPRGLDTTVGERGTQLSGGQRQRIAVARALLKDAPILVLDEATSSVDTASEARIQRALDQATRGRTTLVIAHRLSTVQNADRILVLDAGRIVQAGTHDDLRAHDGPYRALLQSQESTVSTATTGATTSEGEGDR